MTKKITARITSIGAYLPERILTNADLEKMVDTSDSWIIQRTGIRERRIAAADEYTSTMGERAAREALAAIQMKPEQLDAIICATMTPDYISPSTAGLIQAALKATSACAFDIQAACTGFLYALSIAKGWIESGMYKNVLVIASEKNSAFIDYEDRNTCVLFGDGAGACIVQAESPGLAIEHISLGADGTLAHLIEIPGGGCRHAATAATVDQKQHVLKVQGREVFKHAVRRMEAAVTDCLKKTGHSESDIHWLVPHQANIRIMEALAEGFSIPWERVFKTIERYGNTSSSTIPIALHELQKQHTISDGENILLVAFGGGLTWGASLLTQRK